MYTFHTVATFQPLPGQFMVGIAAAGDDRTFVIEAEVGGQRPEIRGKKVGTPINSPTIAFDELRLDPDYRPVSLIEMFSVPAKKSSRRLPSHRTQACSHTPRTTGSRPYRWRRGQYDVSDPAHPREVGSVRLGGITGRVAHPGAPGEALAGGPQMVEVSRDGKRIYLSNSLYGAWDDQFYPDGVGSWLARSTPIRPRAVG